MSTLRLVIGNKNYSSWSLRAWLVLKHLGLEFEEICLDLRDPAFIEKISAFSQARLVPVLLDGDLTIWDSLAICEYLGEQHPHLWPLALEQRALARSAVAEMHSGFQALRQELPMNCRGTPRQQLYSQQAAADIQRLTQLWRDCLHSHQTLNTQHTLSPHQTRGPWLFGEFTLTDAYFAPVVLRFHGYGVELDALSQQYCSTQLQNPHLQQWLQEARLETSLLPDSDLDSASA